MSRKLKVLGLAILAVFVLSSMAVSAAKAAFNTHHVTVPTAPAIFTAEQESGESKPVYSLTGGAHKVECGTVKYSGTVTEKTNSAVTTRAENSGCKVDGLIESTLDINHCSFILAGSTDVNGHAQLELECAEGNETTVTYSIFGSTCVIHIPPQVPQGGLHYTQTTNPTTGKKDITIKVTVSGPKYTETGGGFCSATATKEDGTLQGGITAQAYEDKGTAGCEQAAEGTNRTTPASAATTEGCEGAAIDLELNENVTEP